MKLELNDKVRVKDGTAHHPGRIGYFQFYAGPNLENVVCSVVPTSDKDKKSKYTTYFVVAESNLEKVSE